MNLFGEEIIEEPLKVNIYADESMNRKDHFGNNWNYICIIMEREDNPLLPAIKIERFLNNFDQSSPYYVKNNKILHWSELYSADEKNICKRWFEFIVNPHKSNGKFYCYILGLNENYLNDDEFDKDDRFNSIYNRFFRTAVEYGLKSFFGSSKIIVDNIYHEQGIQQNSLLFDWHSISKLSNEFKFQSDKICFLSKDHKQNEKANILQLCDCFLGAVINIIHGLECMGSKKSSYRKDLLDIILPLVEELTSINCMNRNNKFEGCIIRFFPKVCTKKDSPKRQTNLFYCSRELQYKEDKFGISKLF